MQLSAVLDVFEGLFRAAGHPDVVDVGRYGADVEPGGSSPAGVKLRDVRGGHMYLWGARWKGETPLAVPEVLPTPRFGHQRIAVFAAQLLEAAQPTDLFESWRLVALPDIGPTEARGQVPAGVSVVCVDGTKVLLRSTHGSSPTGDPDVEPCPEYRIPVEEVRQWHLKVSARSAAHA